MNFTDYNFWFKQPSLTLSGADIWAGYVFAGLFVLGVLAWLAGRFAVKHKVVAKLFSRIANWGIWIGILGIIWFGFRYQNIPIFSKRLWPGLVGLGGLFWLSYIANYAMFRFGRERTSYDQEVLRSRYIPGRK